MLNIKYGTLLANNVLEPSQVHTTVEVKGL